MYALLFYFFMTKFGRNYLCILSEFFYFYIKVWKKYDIYICKTVAWLFIDLNVYSV